jgi:hypothetical protein
MKIAYVAKHDMPDNDDEGAIAHSFEELGHQVVRISEACGRNVARERGVDLLLFHKWDDWPFLRSYFDAPKAFWYFDLVGTGGDTSLTSRSRHRRVWMDRMIPAVDVGFMTDGDFVKADPSGKLVVLRQGADGRIVGRGTPRRCKKCCEPIDEALALFVGSEKGCGIKRLGFVEHARRAFGKEFRHIARGVYRTKLADAIAESSFVLAPDFPVTDDYWSNRVYVSLGFGACMLHPYASGLAHEYRGGFEILYYHDLQDMTSQIHKLRSDWGKRMAISEGALTATIGRHLYRHRVISLLATLKERRLL